MKGAAPEMDNAEERMTTSDPQPNIVTACVLIIGNEILSGRTQDANLAFLANGLNEVGIRLREARVIPAICSGLTTRRSGGAAARGRATAPPLEPERAHAVAMRVMKA